MAVNIGPKIGIDGEAEFRKNLSQIGQQIKTLGTEMKAVTSAFDANDKSQEALSAQAQVLNRQLSLQEQRLAEIQRALDYARQNYDENSNEVQRWQQAMNNATAEVNTTRAQLSKLEREMDDAGNAADDLADGMEDAGDAAGDSSGKFDTATVAIGNLVANAISAAVSAIGDLISSLWNLDDATEEYRAAQGRLNTAFDSAGYSADVAQDTYRAFYRILGDTGQATEASQLLAQLSLSQQDLSTWTEIAAGVYGTFGESLPIEGLIEAANETANVGTVTGVLADALNWVGISEDEFNAKLAECTTEAERNQLIMDTLSGQYDEAADSFHKNNAAIEEARDNQTRLAEVLGKLGETVSDVKNSVLSDLIPTFERLADSVDWDALGQSISNFIKAIIDNGPTILSVVAGIGAAFLAWKITSVITTVVTAIQSLIPALTGATTAQMGLNTAMAANPVGVIITLIAGLVTALITLWNTNEGFREAVTAIWAAIVGVFTTAWEAIKTAWSTVVEFFSGIWEGIKGVFSAVGGWFQEKFQEAKTNVETAWSTVKGFFGNVWEGIKTTFSTVGGWFQEKFQEARTNVEAAWDTAGSFFDGVWENIKNAFSSAWDDFTTIGQNIINGIKNGIKAAWDGLVSWFSSLWDSLFGNRTATVNVQRNVTTNYRSTRADGSHAGGLGYVPFDGYLAELHKGEMVLTREDAAALRTFSAAAAIPSDYMESIVNNAAAGMVNGLSTMSGPSFPQTIVLTLENGAEIARWLLPYNRMAARANPEVVSGV